MKTNDIKKGMRVKLANGWEGTMADNMRGSTRVVEVEGFFTEMGSVYSHDIKFVRPTPDSGWLLVEHTPEQLKLKKAVGAFFG